MGYKGGSDIHEAIWGVDRKPGYRAACAQKQLMTAGLLQ
jgi:hypothetical protein